MFELLMLLSQIQISCLNKGSLIPYGHVSGRLVINDYPRIFCSETIKVTNMNNKLLYKRTTDDKAPHALTGQMSALSLSVLCMSSCHGSIDISLRNIHRIGYEPADLTVHPPRTAEGGFIFFV